MPSPVHPSKPLGTGIRIMGEARKSLATELSLRYAAGESIRSLAESTGRSYGFVQSLLKEAGVEFRARGGATRGAQARARQQASREAASAVPRIATELALGGQPAVADEEMAEKARKRASKAVKRTPHLERQDILKKAKDAEDEKPQKGRAKDEKSKGAKARSKDEKVKEAKAKDEKPKNSKSKDEKAKDAKSKKSKKNKK